MPQAQTVPQFLVNRAAFARELDFVSMAGETKNTIPILATVKLDAGDGILKLTATNLDVTAQSQVPILDVSGAGAICVDLRRLSGLVKNISEGEVSLAVEPGKLQVKAGRSKFSLAGWEVDKFPNVENVEGQLVALPTAALKAMIAATVRAVDVEVSKFGNTQVMELRASGGRLLTTACNQQLALRTEVEIAPAYNNPDFSVGLHRPFFPALASLSVNSDAPTVCVIGERAVKFENGHRAVSGKLMSGNLPQYDLLFNRKKDVIGKFEKVDFQQALRRLFVVSDDTEKGFKPLSVTVASDYVELTTEAKDVGTGNDGFAIESAIANFNCRSNAFNLRGALDACESSRLEMSRDAKSVRFDATWLVTESITLRFTALCATLA